MSENIHTKTLFEEVFLLCIQDYLRIQNTAFSTCDCVCIQVGSSWSCIYWLSTLLLSTALSNGSEVWSCFTAQQLQVINPTADNEGFFNKQGRQKQSRRGRAAKLRGWVCSLMKSLRKGTRSQFLLKIWNAGRPFLCRVVKLFYTSNHTGTFHLIRKSNTK